jgi:hypothetical protein
MPAVTTPCAASALALGIAAAGLEVGANIAKGRDDKARQAAAKLAAAGIRLVEHLDQDWP